MKRPLCVLGALVAAAVFFLMLVIPAEEYPTPPDQEMVTITGIICGKEERTNSFSGEKQLVLYLETDNGRKVMLYLDDMRYELPMGCVLRASGQVKNFRTSRNPGEFDSRTYYRTLKIEYSLTNVSIVGIGGRGDMPKEMLYRARVFLESVIDKTLQPEDAGIMKAILLGDKNSLDDEAKESFKRNGMIHIMSVSGLHISIIGMALYRLLRRTGTRVSFSVMLAVSVMYMYGAMCGMSTSAFRAIVMFAVHLGADIIGRTYDMLSALALAGIMLIVSEPLYLRHSGFLMSFGAVIAIGYVLPAMPEIIRAGKLKPFSASLSIMLVTLPVNMSFYYTYPVYSILLNLLVLPLMSVLMLFGIVSTVIGALFVPAGILAGTPCHLIIRWFVLCCSAGKQLPGNTWYAGHADVWQVCLYLVSLGIFVFLKSISTDRTDRMDRTKWEDRMGQEDRTGREDRTGCKNRTGREDRKVPEDQKEKIRYENRSRMLGIIRYVVLAAGLFILCLRIRPELRITTLDVGQGDGIVIETKTANYLIDGGSTSKKDIAKYQLIPFLSYQGIGKLDAVIISHEDEDHISGVIEMMEEMQSSNGSVCIKRLILPRIDKASKGENYRKLESMAYAAKIPVSYIGRGDMIRNQDIDISCIGPVKNMITDEPNAYSTVLYIRKGDFKGLFTGDVDGQGQQELVRYIRENQERFRDITLLKVAHHGSRYTTDEEFLELTNPRVALISCGINNRYQHPHKELVERLDKIGAKTYITAENGAITASLDGDSIKIKTCCD